MRRQGDSGGGGGGYGGAAAQMHQRQQQSDKSGYFMGRHQEQQLVGENDGGQPNDQWRWPRDGKLPQTAMSPTAISSYSEGQGRDAPRSYYQDQRQDSRIVSDRQGGVNPRSSAHEENMSICYEDSSSAATQTFESFEKRIFDDTMKMWSEQMIAVDTENARHKERMKAINSQYEEQLAALRARHASQREELLHRESQGRKEHYQKFLMEQYPASGPGNFSAPREEFPRAYNSDSFNSHRGRGRFSSSARDHGYDSKVPYSRGRAHNTGPRYHN